MITIANRLEIPNTTKAILWDMDGVLIDSLGVDLSVCNVLLQKRFGGNVVLPRSYIQSIFAYSVSEFWNRVLTKVSSDFGLEKARDAYEAIIVEYENMRQQFQFQLCPGIREILAAVQERGLEQAVVSNNPTAQISIILRNAGVEKEFDCIVGNDIRVGQQMLQKKPAPDTYLYAIQQLGFSADTCVVVEDSLIGIEAGKTAGCFVIGVATGGATIEELRALGNKIDRVYETFHESI